MRVLLTGGAGFLGSHLAVSLLTAGHSVIVLDDFSNSTPSVLGRISAAAGCSASLITVDLTQPDAVRSALHDVDFDAVVHLAGLKAVGESVRQPLRYYGVNANATLTVLELMQERDVRKVIFSSSASVYGDAEAPGGGLHEGLPVGVGLRSPYAWTKLFSEQLLRDTQRSRPELEVTVLRYFNPVGAHPSGLLGEEPQGTPNNLMPYVAQVAAGQRPRLEVFGNSYPTPDGTGVRDYLHVMDLAEGHLAALEHSEPGFQVYNLGTGVGVSVLELIRTYAAAADRPLPYTVVAPREGDVPVLVADPSRAHAALGWRATRSLEEACADSWRWEVGR